MTIEVSAGLLFVRFGPDDFQRKPGAYQVIAGIKDKIGHYSKNPNGFDFDEAEKQWVIADTPGNRKILEELRDTSFVDPEQINLFGPLGAHG